MRVLVAAILAAGCSGRPPELPGPTADELRRLPHIAAVEVFPAREPATHRIIHVANWHFIPLDAFATEGADDLDREYAEFLDEVEVVQAEQRELLRAMGVRQVYLEGLFPETLPEFRRRIEALREFERHKPAGDTPIEQLILSEYRDDLLDIGSPGQLLLSGELDSVLPADDRDLMEAANPLVVGYYGPENDAREAAIVRRLLDGGPVAVVVLGGAHDLSDNVPGTCEYVRVVTTAHLHSASIPNWSKNASARQPE